MIDSQVLKMTGYSMYNEQHWKDISIYFLKFFFRKLSFESVSEKHFADLSKKV